MISKARLAAPFDPLGVALLAALLLLPLWPPVVPYDIGWEVAASLGYVACCAIALTLRLTPAARANAGIAYRATIHRAAGHAALALVLGHVLVMLAVDPFVIDYLGWMMPIHVLAGALAALALLLTVVSREPVFRLRRLRANRHVHVWAGIAATGLTGWHVLASSAKVTAAWQPALIAALFLLLLVPAAVSAARRAGWWPRRRASHRGLGGAARPRVARARTADILYLLALLGGIAALLTAVPQLLTVWAPVEP